MFHCFNILKIILSVFFIASWADCPEPIDATFFTTSTLFSYFITKVLFCLIILLQKYFFFILLAKTHITMVFGIKMKI